MISGIVFDLDGTLVDSGLDFEAMRREMELPPGEPILEALKHLQPAHAARSGEVLHRHEREGLARATLLPGVRELLATLKRRRIHTAIATRNSRSITAATLARFQLTFDPVLTRDDGPVKPDPWPVLHACQQWGLGPSQVVVVGDYRFDVESGRAAGARTVLLTHPQDPRQYANHEQADLLLTSLAEYPRLLAWLEAL
ncbi:MAG TPA: HAD family hydrolase [Pirellulaceae bacterium]|nr:HAD family hydrolase [Pirellulaceae bacterium]